MNRAFKSRRGINLVLFNVMCYFFADFHSLRELLLSPILYTDDQESVKSIYAMMLYNFLRLIGNDKLKNIRTAIMSDNIEIEPALNNFVKIQCCSQYITASRYTRKVGPRWRCRHDLICHHPPEYRRNKPSLQDKLIWWQTDYRKGQNIAPHKQYAEK
ncbi:hypothetical protein D3C78_622040 [compost metagenome]